MIGVLPLAFDLIRRAWRSGLVAAVGLAVAAAMVWLPTQASGEALDGGRLAAVWSLGLGLAQALIFTAVAVLAVDGLARDVRDGQAALLATQPQGRVRWWLGRWLGAALLGLGWLALAVGVGLIVAGGQVPAAWQEIHAPQVQPLALPQGTIVDTGLEGPPGRLRLYLTTPEGDDAAGTLEILSTTGARQAITVQPFRTYESDWPGGRLGLWQDGWPALVIDPGRDLVLRVPAGSGAANLLRVVVLLALQVLFVAALGAAAAGALRYPLALLAVLAWLFAAAHAPLLSSSLRPPGAQEEELLAHGHHADDGHDHGVSEGWWLEVLEGARLTGWSLTDALHRWWRVGDLGAGRLVPGAEVGQALLRLGLLQTVAVAVAGILLWRRRELALGDES